MKYLVYILLFISTCGYSQYGYQGQSTTASLTKPQQIRKTVSPGSNMLYVIGTKPSLLTPSYLRIQDSSTIASYGVDQRLRITTGGGTIGLTRNFGAADYVVLKDSSLSNEGLLTASLSSSNNSQILSNTSGATAVHIIAAGTSTLGVSGQNITITSADQYVGTVTSIGITPPAAGITVSGSPVTTSGNITLALADDLLAVEGLSGAGFAVRTAANTWALRSIATADASNITVTTPTGNIGNPTLNLATTAVTGASYGSTTQVGTFTVDAYGRLTAAANASISITGIGGVPTSRTISTTAPLSGGGDLSANRTITTSMATNKLIGRSTAGTGVMEEITLGDGLSYSSTTLNVASQTLSRYLLGLKLTNYNAASSYISLPDSTSSNEGSLTVGAGTGSTSIINSNTSGSTGVTLTAAGILAISEAGNVITLTATEIGTVSSVSGTTNRISVTGGTGAAVVDIAATYVGQTSITTVGTLVSGTWNATDIAFANIAQLPTLTLAGNSTGSTADIQAITLGSGLTFSAGQLFATDASVTNEGVLSVSAGSGTTSVINSSTFGSPSVTLTAGTGVSISENTGTSTITLSATGTGIEHIKAGTAVYEKGIDVASNTARDTFTVSFNYPTLPTLDSTLCIVCDMIPISANYDDIDHNSKISKFNFLKKHERTLSSGGATYNWDADDSFGIVYLNNATAITYKLKASPTDREEVWIISTIAGGGGHTIDGNGKNINASATVNVAGAYTVYHLFYSASLGKWLKIN